MEEVGLLLEQRSRVFLRQADGLMILQSAEGEAWFRLNGTAATILRMLFDGSQTEEVVAHVAQGEKPEVVAKDVRNLVGMILDSLEEPNCHWQCMEEVAWRWELALPPFGEITLTPRCQNRCKKCYMGADDEADEVAVEAELTFEDLCRIIDRLADEVQVKEIIVSGGEPTLRPELPEIIAYIAAKGLRSNLITNGILVGLDPDYAKRLAKAGLTTAQVSLDSPVQQVHNKLVGRRSYQQTLAGLLALRDAGIFTYPNSTLCRGNAESLLEMPRFLQEKGFGLWSANGLIPSGSAVENLDSLGMTYTQFALWVPRLKQAADEEGIEFSWILPVPHCLLPPASLGFDEKGCTAANTVAIINARGQYVACNNLPDEVLGDMLDGQSFTEMHNSEAARWWRERRFMPETCKDCPFSTSCCGACPQYWLNYGNLTEIAEARGVSIPPDYTQEWRRMFDQRPRREI